MGLSSCYLDSMKFSREDPADGYVIRSYSDKELVVGDSRYSCSLIVMPERIIAEWHPRYPEQLQAGDFEMLSTLSVDLVLLGTGRRQVFPQPPLYRSLIDAGKGLEIMDTPAACRTYNVLISEGRLVAAALIL
jgi:uncharacterized protein